MGRVGRQAPHGRCATRVAWIIQKQGPCPNGSNTAEVGHPMIIVLSRTYHAGFRKQWPVLDITVRLYHNKVHAADCA